MSTEPTTESAVAIVTMTEAKARKVTEEIQRVAFAVLVNMDGLHRAVEQAKNGNAHIVLGYPSWTAYLADVLGKAADGAGWITPGLRRDVVGYLSREGMSTRAIAPIVGADHSTVVRDLRQVVHDAPPDPDDDDDLTVAIAGMRKVMSDHPIPENELSTAVDSRVTGRDGKQYPRPEMKERRKPRRTSLPDAFRDTVYDLAKAVRRLERLTADDRFKDNRESIRARNNGEISLLHKTLWNVRKALGDEAGQ